MGWSVFNAAVLRSARFLPDSCVCWPQILAVHLLFSALEAK